MDAADRQGADAEAVGERAIDRRKVIARSDNRLILGFVAVVGGLGDGVGCTGRQIVEGDTLTAFHHNGENAAVSCHRDSPVGLYDVAAVVVCG